MNLGNLVLVIGSVAIVLTLVIGFLFKKHKSWSMTFLQNFTGVLFVFSGWVKAVDPLGTAYKMQQYFAEFEYTFMDTWFSFLAPIFPLFSKYAIGFSVAMIVFEIVLGLMLLLGAKSKLTSWAFLLLVAFFTVLTGFTFLTGYVQNGANFFSFGQWGAYDANNMKVTDCGCFGDFIKLEPKISFYKDLVLLVPAIYFVFRHKDMHALFTEHIRKIILGVATVGLIFYCMTNYTWDLPHTDFRPFKKGTDVKTQKQLEEDAMNNVLTTHWILENKGDGSKLTLENQEYLANFKNYPKEEWNIVDKLNTEPAVKQTKISDFEITDVEGNDLTYDILDSDQTLLLIVSHELKGSAEKEKYSYQDTLYALDTLVMFDPATGEETQAEVERIDTIHSREGEKLNYVWNSKLLTNYIDKVKPFVDQAKDNNWKAIAVFGGADDIMLSDFREDTGLNVDYAIADDILLKTIVRSNPGVVLWKNGVILDKWHIKKLPKFEKVVEKYNSHLTNSDN